jgi:hypothetical protein
MKQNQLFRFGLFILVALLFYECDESNKVDLPTSAIIHYSVADKQVAFTALAHNANTYSWDFGDGETSTEPNPVHVYESGGYYTAMLSVTGGTGTVEDEVKLAIALTPYVLLTGGPTAENGKTWKLSTAHSGGDDYLATADAALTLVEDTPRPLPDGIFSTEFGMGDIYDDTYTFFFDGSYQHDVKGDGGAFGGFVYQYYLTGFDDATLLGNLVNPSAGDIMAYVGAGGEIGDLIEDLYGLCIAKYTPESGATFTFNESEDFTVSSVYAPPSYSVTFNSSMTLDFSGTEFIGFRDFQRKVIMTSISDSKMQLIMFMAAGTNPSIIGVNTHALILTFEAVD